LDLPELSHVIQYEPPDEAENYIHRAGRTGRAGGTGVAITLVNSMEKVALDRIARQYEIELEERITPSDEDVANVVSERLTALLEARLRDRDRLQSERSLRFTALARELADQEEELPIITMLLDDYYQQMLHAAAPQPSGETKPEQARKSAPRRGSRRRGGRKR
jgi:ATP-dependent RNA helicase DeaD